MREDRGLRLFVTVLIVIVQAHLWVFNSSLISRDALVWDDCVTTRRVKGEHINPDYEAAIDLVLSLAKKGDYRALDYLEGKVRNILSRDLSQKPISAEELYMLRGLSDIEQRTLVGLVVREDVPIGIRREFLSRLAGGGTIDSILPKVLEQAERESQILAFFRQITEVYKEFTIVAPGLLVKELLSGNLTLQDLKRYIPQIEQENFGELISLLKNNHHARLAYYCLKQSQFRYGVVYPYQRFSQAIDKIPSPIEGANDRGVLEELRQALGKELGEEEAGFIIQQLRQGKAPLRSSSRYLDEQGNFIPQEVSLEYSNQVMEDMQRSLKETYRGLTALLKLSYIAEKLGIEIKEMTTDEAMQEKLDELLREHPELEGEAGRYLAQLTKRMKSDPLLGTLLQVTEPGGISTLSEIEEPDLDRFLAYLDKKGINIDEVLDKLEGEIAEGLKPSFSHLREGFRIILSLKESKAEVQGRLRSSKVYIRYADKRDLISFLRFADGAQCCITSTGEGHLSYVPYALADHMTHVFVLSDDKNNQLGYILTHYGIDDEGSLVLLSLQVYLRHGYHTQSGLKNIWEIMEAIAEDMGVKMILQATGSFGLGRIPDWLPKENVTVKRLQSISGVNLVDDLGLNMNQPVSKEFYVIEVNKR